MNTPVYPTGLPPPQRRSQAAAFTVFRVLSYFIVLVLFAILGFIIYKGRRSPELGLPDQGPGGRK